MVKLMVHDEDGALYFELEGEPGYLQYGPLPAEMRELINNVNGTQRYIITITNDQDS